ncbi:hypothetical protein HN51_057762 [Arachis hypogaea]
MCRKDQFSKPNVQQWIEILVDQLNNQLPDARFTYINTYGVFQDIISNSASYDFQSYMSAPCNQHAGTEESTCLGMHFIQRMLPTQSLVEGLTALNVHLMLTLLISIA